MQIQKPQISRNFMYIAVAVILAILASVVAVQYVKRQVEERTKDDRELMQVAVPVNDMPQGAIIAEGDLASRTVDAELVPADVVTPENYEEHTGRMLRAPVRGGAPLSASALVPLYDQFSKIIPQGKVAYTLTVDENNSISGMIAPGDLIDILFMKDADDSVEAEGAPQTGSQVFPLLDQVRVLATGSRVGERITPDGQVEEEAEGFSSVTLELNSYEAKKLAVASNAGTLRVLLREKNDTSPIGGESLSERALLQSLGGAAGGADGESIEFIIGGKG